MQPRSVRYVRYDPAEWAAVEAAAAQEQVPPSTYVRCVSVRAARRNIAQAGAQQTRSGKQPGPATADEAHTRGGSRR